MGAAPDALTSCGNCAATVSSDHRFCPECGARVGEATDIICRQCGSSVPSASNFCPTCAASLRSVPPPILQEGNVEAHPSARRSVVKRILLVGSLTLLLLGALAGSYLTGAASRMSDSEVTAKITKEVATAVDARSELAAEEQAEAVTAALDNQKEELDKKWAKKLKTTVSREKKQSYKKGHEAGYTEGNSAGYSTGHSAGYETGHTDGLWDGSDELVCSDDPDVTWLPACW